jgi:hypothetical protein
MEKRENASFTINSPHNEQSMAAQTPLPYSPVDPKSARNTRDRPSPIREENALVCGWQSNPYATGMPLQLAACQ